MPTSFSYAWRRCNSNGRLCTPIPGATLSTYTITAADAAHALVAVVTATFRDSSQSALSTALLIR